jgi:hypothetical protein
MSFCLHIKHCVSKLDKICPKVVNSQGNLIFMLAELPPEQCRGQKIPQNIDLKAMAWAIGLAWPMWPGLAWLLA